MFWIDGSAYKGQWDKGAQSGEGLMTYNDGTTKRIQTHQRNTSDISSYISQDDLLSNQFGARSDKKNKLKIKLINHSNLPSASNNRLRSNENYGTAQETGQQQFNNFMKAQGTHKRYHSKDEFPKMMNSHYSIQPRNRSLDLRKHSNRIPTGHKSSNYSITKLQNRYK